MQKVDKYINILFTCQKINTVEPVLRGHLWVKEKVTL